MVNDPVGDAVVGELTRCAAAGPVGVPQGTDPGREDLVVADGKVHIGVDGPIAVRIGVEVAEAGEGDARNL